MFLRDVWTTKNTCRMGFRILQVGGLGKPSGPNLEVHPTRICAREYCRYSSKLANQTTNTHWEVTIEEPTLQIGTPFIFAANLCPLV